MRKRLQGFSLLELMLVIALAGLLAACMVNCSGMQVKIGEQGKEVLAEEAGFELGLYLGKKTPKIIPVLYDFVAAMESAIPGTAPDVTALLRDYISKRCTKDPYGQARLERLLGLIELDVPEPAALPEKLQEYTRYLKAAGKGLKQALDIITGK